MSLIITYDKVRPEETKTKLALSSMSGGRVEEEKEHTKSEMLPKYPHHHHRQQHHLVLIHGIGHGAWCWYKIRCLLEASGYKVTCLDLKGAGIDQSDPNTILTFQDYNKPLINFLSNLPLDEKVSSP